jgi:hypothetical protein
MELLISDEQANPYFKESRRATTIALLRKGTTPGLDWRFGVVLQVFLCVLQ